MKTGGFAGLPTQRLNKPAKLPLARLIPRLCLAGRDITLNLASSSFTFLGNSLPS